MSSFVTHRVRVEITRPTLDADTAQAVSQIRVQSQGIINFIRADGPVSVTDLADEKASLIFMINNLSTFTDWLIGSEGQPLLRCKPPFDFATAAMIQSWLGLVNVPGHSCPRDIADICFAQVAELGTRVKRMPVGHLRQKGWSKDFPDRGIEALIRYDVGRTWDWATTPIR